MKRIVLALALCLAVSVVACKPEGSTPAPEPTPEPTVTVVPTETPTDKAECVTGDREETAVGGGRSNHVNCRECVDGKWKPCKEGK